ncbi:hypothetical protein MUN77_01370 [Leucobacter allii]|uniref:hypothetical protein n=1 Tax=Leucobacter allii TaxID=2932247 RepID=UPI001FD61DC0|nr:hypothetical protein [Leucobacter allii]UOR02010.1 hypothetical protein MUN77_01370 [Leucobacter allii]
MPTRIKKDRRKSGVKFTKAPKVSTPLEDRHEFREAVTKPRGLRDGGKEVPRSQKQLRRVREAWGVA